MGRAHSSLYGIAGNPGYCDLVLDENGFQLYRLHSEPVQMHSAPLAVAAWTGAKADESGTVHLKSSESAFLHTGRGPHRLPPSHCGYDAVLPAGVALRV